MKTLELKIVLPNRVDSENFRFISDANWPKKYKILCENSIDHSTTYDKFELSSAKDHFTIYDKFELLNAKDHEESNDALIDCIKHAKYIKFCNIILNKSLNKLKFVNHIVIVNTITKEEYKCYEHIHTLDHVKDLEIVEKINYYIHCGRSWGFMEARSQTSMIVPNNVVRLKYIVEYCIENFPHPPRSCDITPDNIFDKKMYKSQRIDTCNDIYLNRFDVNEFKLDKLIILLGGIILMDYTHKINSDTITEKELVVFPSEFTLMRIRSVRIIEMKQIAQCSYVNTINVTLGNLIRVDCACQIISFENYDLYQNMLVQDGDEMQRFVHCLCGTKQLFIRKIFLPDTSTDGFIMPVEMYDEIERRILTE